MPETTHAPAVPEPGTRFNFAQHLIECNTSRPAKTAYIDDVESVSYGELAERIRRLAAGLLAAGVRREERVLLLMHDCSDWPVSFLGAMYAGIVPVAVNTLLTADDYAFMLAHSRAQAVLVSSALLPVLQEAMNKAAHEVRTVIVSRPDGVLPQGITALDGLIGKHQPLAQAAPTGPDDPGFWLYSSGSTGQPKGALHTHANP
ncbi:MAG: benzoate-CoA ligase, partial [Polaromonas sp.]|nr:benzoate-CoA ligase [Polaromonas sp.]